MVQHHLSIDSVGCVNGAGRAKDECKNQRETGLQLSSRSSLVGGEHEPAFICGLKLLTAVSFLANRREACEETAGRTL